MKKVERYIYIVLIIILVGIIISGTTYIIMKNNDKTEIKENNNNQNNNEKDNNQNEEPTKEDGVKLLKTYNLNDKIIEEFEITLNGKINNMKIEFDYDEEDYTEEETLSIVDGKFNNNTLITYFDFNSPKSKIFNLDIIKNEFNEGNFKIIKGTDNKSYLLLATKISNDFNSESHLLVFNDNLEQIKGDFEGYSCNSNKEENMVVFTTATGYKPKNGTPIDYKDDFNLNYHIPSVYGEVGVNVKIENNKIYYLVPIFNWDINDEGILEEREYTLNNNKYEYKVINTYKELVPFAGQGGC